METQPKKEYTPLPAASLASVDRLDPASFDWKAFRSTYKGRALITRLLWVARTILSGNPSPQSISLACSAASQAIPLLKDTWDVDNYFAAVNMVHRCLALAGEGMDLDGDAASESETPEARTGKPDLAWVNDTKAAAKAEASRLGVELNGYMSNLIKESIRLTYLAMAQLSLKEGNLPAALKAFQQVREFSSGPAHHVELGLAIINAALSFIEPLPLSGNIPKVEAMIDRLYPTTSAVPVSSTMTTLQVQANRAAEARNQAARRAVVVKLRVARAVVALSHHDYAKAARELGEVGEEGGLDEWDGEAMSTPDVAFICAVCTLATRGRDHIRRVLLDRASFHAALGDHQGYILDLVRAFVDARYGETLRLLQQAEPYMVLNPFLAPHAASLLAQIRTRGIVQYLSPFSTVRVSAMAAAFGADEGVLLRELCGLAEAGEIPVRIDLVNRVLSIDEKDPRADAFRSALDRGTAITGVIAANTLRMRLKEAGVVVDAAPSQRKDVDWQALRSK